MKEKQNCLGCGCKWTSILPEKKEEIKVVACPKCHKLVKAIGGKKHEKKNRKYLRDY